MRPDNHDMIESRRREAAATFTGTMVDVDTLLDLAPPCTWDQHATGANGCEPGAPAEFVIRVRQHCGPPMPTILLICEAQWIRLRRIQLAPYTCEGCERRTTLAALVDYLGRVDGYYP